VERKEGKMTVLGKVSWTDGRVVLPERERGGGNAPAAVCKHGCVVRRPRSDQCCMLRSIGQTGAAGS
jgi:hypothetical protein